MRPMIKVSLLAGALALTWALAGCGNNQEPAVTTTTTPATDRSSAPTTGNAPATQAAPAKMGAAKAGAAPGTQQLAGAFQVTLTTEPTPPKVGEVSFLVKVTRGGKPVKGAAIKLSTSMPSMSMSGPEVALKPMEDHYMGSAKLSMAGDYEAKVVVSAAGETGAATYHFTTGQ